MKYVIPVALSLYTLLMIGLVLVSGYAAITQDWTWLLVSFGFSFSAIAGILATSAAFSAVKDW